MAESSLIKDIPPQQTAQTIRDESTYTDILDNAFHKEATYTDTYNGAVSTRTHGPHTIRLQKVKITNVLFKYTNTTGASVTPSTVEIYVEGTLIKTITIYGFTITTNIWYALDVFASDLFAYNNEKRVDMYLKFDAGGGNTFTSVFAIEGYQLS